MKLENSTGSYKANQPKREWAISTKSRKKEEIKKRNLPRFDQKQSGTYEGRREKEDERKDKKRTERKRERESESPNYKSSEKARREIHKDI